MLSHGISAWSATWSVHDQPGDHFMIAMWCEWNCMSKWKRKVYSNDPSFFQICIATVLVWVCCWSLLMGPISSLPCLQSILHIYCRSWGFPHSSVGKESAGNAGDPGSIPGSGRSAWEGKGYPFQYSGLENSMDYTVYGVTETDTTERLSPLLSWYF